jgi:tetratricopeptide (TPR) repeat protein
MALAVAGSLALVGGPVAHAAGPPRPNDNPSAQDLARAKELYDNGRSLYDEGSYAGAAFAFEEAYKLSGDINVLYNISLAFDRAGDFEKSLEYLEYYRALAPEAERAKLGKKVESLKKRLAKQQEEAAEAAAAGDGGDEPAPEDEPTPAPTDPATDQPPPDDDGPKIFTPAAAVLAAVSGVGLALGTGFGIASLNKTRAAEDQCSDGLCDTGSRNDLDKAKTRALVADISIAVGAAAGVALIAIVVTNVVKRKRARSTTARLRPSAGGFAVVF